MTFTSETPIRYTRRLRSFVTRQGRATVAQQRALQRLWPAYGLEPNGIISARNVFPGLDQLVVELGFGMGDSLIELASRHPDKGFIGIEVHTPGIGRLLSLAEAASLKNLRVCHADGVEVLQHRFAAETIDKLLLFFPDPWPKKRHHKRRLINIENVSLFADRLRPGGTIELATDWLAYAQQMLEVLEAEPRLRNCAGPGRFAERPSERPVTKFERRGERLGHQIRDLIFERK